MPIFPDCPFYPTILYIYGQLYEPFGEYFPFYGEKYLVTLQKLMLQVRYTMSDAVILGQAPEIYKLFYKHIKNKKYTFVTGTVNHVVSTFEAPVTRVFLIY